MFKKIILIWMLMFSSLFSSGEDFITTLPRKEKAYLDIEVTKIKTEVRDIVEIDQLNKTIKLRDIALDTSQSLILTENPDVFGALFSVNGRIGALRNIAKETNLSYSSDEASSEVTINYNELPSNIYAGVWNKNSRNLEKMYSLNLHVPTPLDRILSINIEDSVYVSSSIEPVNGKLYIDIGSLSLSGYGSEGFETILNFEPSNKVIFETLGGLEIEGTLCFNLNGSYKFDSFPVKFKDMNNVKITVCLDTADLKEIDINELSKISFKSGDNGTYINFSDAQNGKPIYTDRELIFKDFDIYFTEFFEIKYLPPYSTFFLKGTETEDVNFRIGHVDIRKASKHYNMSFSEVDVDSKVVYSFGSDNDFSVEQGTNGFTDIVLKIPKSTIESASRDETIVTQVHVIRSTDNRKYELGPYHIVFSNKPISALVLTKRGSDVPIEDIILNHDLVKGTPSNSEAYQDLTLKRVNGDPLLIGHPDKDISISFGNSYLKLANNLYTTLEASPEYYELDFQQKYFNFRITSTITAADINHDETIVGNTYSNSTTLNIEITN